MGRSAKIKTMLDSRIGVRQKHLAEDHLVHQNVCLHKASLLVQQLAADQTVHPRGQRVGAMRLLPLNALQRKWNGSCREGSQLLLPETHQLLLQIPRPALLL